MRMFTVTYDRSGRVATATVQGTEISTTDDLLCICEDGVPLATFPKQSVLHVTSNNPGDTSNSPGDDRPSPAIRMLVSTSSGDTSNSPGDDRPAPAVDDLGMPVRSPLSEARAEGREEYWTRLRTALDPTPPRESAARVGRRAPTAGGSRGRYGVVATGGSGDSVRSSGARAR